VSSLRNSNPDLEIKSDGAITLLEPGKGAHAIRISQTFVGNSDDGCDANDDASNARIMFATFMDPDTLQKKCGIFQRNVSPCFQETVVVGCDLEANTATINLYVVDESFKKSMTTDNPKMGRCKAGQGDIIKRAIKVTETFDCLPLTEEEKIAIRFNTCSDSSDYCAEGAYCNFSTSDGYRCITGEPDPDCSCSEDEECFYSKLKKGYYCRPFAQPGDSCGGVEVSEISHTCDPKSAFCYLRDSCYNLQQTGICIAFSSDVQCSSDDDCEKSTDLCDVSIGRCKPRLKKDDCCDADSRCGDGLTCVMRTGGYALCHTECNLKEGGSSCAENEFCTYDDSYYYLNGDYYPSNFCKPFSVKGERCGWWQSYVFLDICSPGLYCFTPSSGYYYDIGGTCWPPGKTCQDVSDCELTTEEWCDMTDGTCKPRLQSRYHCDPNIKKVCQEGLECKRDDGEWVCALYDDTCSGQLCGGPAGIKCDCICDNIGQSPICMDSDYDYNGNIDECNPDEGDVNCVGFCTCGSSSSH